MITQLSEHPLAELIRELSEKRRSGSIRVQHEHSKVVVYLEEGRVIYTASNVRSLRLTEYLKQHQLLDEKQLENYGDKRSDLALASALIDKGGLKREDIHSLLRSLVTDALRLALLWTEGTWEFDERARLQESIRVEVDTVTLILECARRNEWSFATSRFPNPEELISLGTLSLATSGLLPTEGFLLSRVEGPISIRELVAISGLPEGDALRVIYGLTLAGLLNRQSWVSVLRPTTQAAVTKPLVTGPPEPPLVPERSEEDDLRDFLARVDAAVSYYEVLDVSAATAAEDIKAAYYDIARKYHPDRFRGQGESPLHARLESAFARITQAYETLMDAGRRRAYDSKLAAEEKAKKFAQAAPKAASTASTQQGSADNLNEVETKQTETIFKEGFAALQQGQINVATGLLGAAARAVPDESRYRAYYGRALAANEKTRRSAERELQVAIRLDPKNAGYRVMLAELYHDLGFFRRAIAEAERAQSMDPQNTGARELLRKLKDSSKSQI